MKDAACGIGIIKESRSCEQVVLCGSAPLFLRAGARTRLAAGCGLGVAMQLEDEVKPGAPAPACSPHQCAVCGLSVSAAEAAEAVAKKMPLMCTSFAQLTHRA